MEITQANIKQVQMRYSLYGASEGVISAIRRAMQVAPFNVSVLVTGESGTGKETIPHIIHDQSPRKHKPFFAVNCGSIPENLIDSALFGHVKGAFTGADSDHQGYFEAADGGTVFLDELGEMPLNTQAKLLRVLETGEFIKLGSSEVHKTDVRIIAATNKDLIAASREKAFREDLYYRISAVEINMPPLRKRGRDDICLLTRFFNRRFADDNRSVAVEYDDSAVNLLASQEWKGNVRELKNVIERIALFEGGKRVTASTIAQYLPHAYSDAPANEGSGLVPWGHGKSEYNKERSIIFASITQISEELKQIKQELQDLHAAQPAYVNSNVSSIKRDLSPLSQVAIDEVDAVIEHVAASGSASSYKINEVAEDAHQIKTLDETERDTIKEALIRNKGRRKQTAQDLQISERTLYRKIKQYSLISDNDS